MILYNYQDADYSIVKIMNSLHKAFMYIKEQEIHEYIDVQELKLVLINSEKDIADNCEQNYYNVCLFNNDAYLSRNFCDTDHISSYIIVKKKVE